MLVGFRVQRAWWIDSPFYPIPNVLSFLRKSRRCSVFCVMGNLRLFETVVPRNVKDYLLINYHAIFIDVDWCILPLKINTRFLYVCKSHINGLLTSRIDYGDAILFGISDRHLHRLKMVQRSAARIVMQIRRGDRQSMTTILRQLQWLPVRKRIEYKLLVLVHRARRHARVSRGTNTPARLSPIATLCRRVTPRSAKSELRTFRPACICLCSTHSVEQTP